MADAKLRKRLLVCGIAAGPVYVVFGVAQMLVRPGFDPTRHALSILANGDLGWIQVANFLLSGLLVLAFAVGVRMTLKGAKGGTWGPLLLIGYGIGLIGAGIFKADPALGFPPGTPADAHAISGSGLMHFVFGGIGFYCLIAACFVFARRFASLKKGGMKWFSVFTGLIFFASFIGISSGAAASESMRAPVMISFYLGVLLIWIWVTALAITLRIGPTECEF